MRNLILVMFAGCLAMPALADPTDDQLKAAQELCLPFRIAPSNCDVPRRNAELNRRPCMADEPPEYDATHAECTTVQKMIVSRSEALRASEAAKNAAIDKKMNDQQKAKANDASNWVKGLVGK